MPRGECFLAPGLELPDIAHAQAMALAGKLLPTVRTAERRLPMRSNCNCTVGPSAGRHCACHCATSVCFGVPFQFPASPPLSSLYAPCFEQDFSLHLLPDVAITLVIMHFAPPAPRTLRLRHPENAFWLDSAKFAPIIRLSSNFVERSVAVIPKPALRTPGLVYVALFLTSSENALPVPRS